MQAPPVPPSPRLPPRRAQARVSGWQRLRRATLVASAMLVAAALISYASAMLGASNSSLGIRSVEWLRDNGAAGLVTKVESIYYSLTAPSKGGAALRALPHVGRGAPSLNGVVAFERPPRIAPLTRPALPGEGLWHSTRVGAGPHAPVLVTTFRSDPTEYPRLVAGVAWIDTHRTLISLYPGRLEPAVELPTRGPMEVPAALRPRLLATFNSGFKLADSGGGFALRGHTYAPMSEGKATFVRYADGRVDIVAWHGGPSVGPDVVFARQNLPLIVDGGHLNPNLNDGPEWGATLGNAIQVWRSGIGVDSHGNLLYAAANYQTVHSLAAVLRHAGAVRAMELDINSYWTSFNSYGLSGAREPTKLLGEMERESSRYLTPDDRDFFAVYER